jgi:glutathione synthase/RimK-type ligase-like ATP-grasp enzyme
VATGPAIGIFSVTDDLHALAVQHELEARGVACHVVETDNVLHAGGLTWTIEHTSREGTSLVRSRDGRMLDVRRLDAIWWRRAGYPQRPHPAIPDEADQALVENEWKCALHGMLANAFSGTWINDPALGRRAENKLLQLQAAVTCGWRVPRTLVGQDPAAVRAFCAACSGNGAIVKTVRGARRRFLRAVIVDPSRLDDRSIALSPAIYQEFVPGTRHLRICCFGDAVHGFSISSSEVDWRADAKSRMEPYALDVVTAGMVKALLRRLGLRMAVMDAKLTPEGDVVWLEANPQGQFLFARA